MKKFNKSALKRLIAEGYQYLAMERLFQIRDGKEMSVILYPFKTVHDTIKFLKTLEIGPSNRLLINDKIVDDMATGKTGVAAFLKMPNLE